MQKSFSFTIFILCIVQKAHPFTVSKHLKVSVASRKKFLPLTVSPSIDPTSSNLLPVPVARDDHLSALEAAVRKITMACYVAAMCVALPLALFPLWAAKKLNFTERTRREGLALDIGEACARWLLVLFPFATISVQSDVNKKDPPEPSIWVCNHTSMLDTFVLLASDRKLRGPKKRPLKVIYWKGLEKNPVTNLLFQLAGFIPVDMAANGSGVPNEYDKASFFGLLRNAKKAFKEGFDLLILPEGQLNPQPERGLLEVFPGAHKLSLISKRPIQMVALHGGHRFWHADPSIGMKVTGRKICARAYGRGRVFDSDDDFVTTFQAVVGQFGTTGVDLPSAELEALLRDGRQPID